MRAPVFALAAVCAAASTAVIVYHYRQSPPVHSSEKKPPAVLPITVADQQTDSISPQVFLVNDEVKPIKIHYSKCNLTFLKKAQIETAVISNATDTIVQFSQGTSLVIHPNDFVSERTGQPIAGPVKLAVSEHYAMEDILANDLTTATKDGLLETNGMINIQAYAANGEACKLRTGGEIEIRFPKVNDKPGMQLFFAEKDSNRNIIWKPMEIKSNSYSPVYKTATVTRDLKNDTVGDTNLNSLPQFPGGLNGIAMNINSVKNHFPIRSTNALIIVDFIIDTDGDVYRVTDIKNNDPVYFDALKEALYKMPAWKPAIVKGRIKPLAMRMAVSFSLNNPKLMKFWSCVKSPDQSFYNMQYYQQWLDSRTRTFYYSSTSDSLLNYYTFKSTSLGLINCDRFYNLPAPKIQMYVAEKPAENLSIKLIFHSIKSVLNGYPTQDKYCFSNVPKGEQVTVLALKGEKGNLQMAVKTTTVSNAVLTNLDFKSVTPEDVKKTLEQFNKLPGAVAKN